jgi:hypothetical protein
MLLQDKVALGCVPSGGGWIHRSNATPEVSEEGLGGG